MKTRRWLYSLLILVFVLIGGWIFFNKGEGTSEEILINPTKGNFQVTVTTTGELRAKNSKKIKGPQGVQRANIYRMSITKIVEEGKIVKEGDYVATLDQEQLKNKISEVQISLDKAQSELTQTKLDTAITLSEKRSSIVNLKFDMDEKLAEMEQSIYEAPATQQQVKLQFDRAKRAYNQALESYQNQVAQAVTKVKIAEAEYNKQYKEVNDYKELLKGFTIKAPADGMVIYDREWDGRKKTVGSNVYAWDPVVATLPDLSIMESATFVNEIDIQKVKVGQKVTVGLDAMADKSLTGEVTSVANVGEQRPNSEANVFEVIVLVNETDTTLRPNMTTSNEVLVAEKKDVLFVPLECLHARDTVSFVFAQKGSKLVGKEVQTGLMNENYAEILQGLSEEDKIYLSVPPSKDTTGMEIVRLDLAIREEVADAQ